MLSHKPPTPLLEWKVTYSNKIAYYKSVILWERADKIILVPQTTEPFILKTFKYKNISIDYSGNALQGTRM